MNEIKDPTPTAVQIQRFFDLINSGRLDCDALQAILNRYDNQPEPVLQNTQHSIQHIIDLDADPFIPEGWSIMRKDQIVSRARGMWELDPNLMSLSRATEQSSRDLQGHDVKRILARMQRRVLPANVLDYLLAHQGLIPYDWQLTRPRDIFFWGTVYRDASHRESVRYLFFTAGEWLAYYRSLHYHYFSNDFAAFLID